MQAITCPINGLMLIELQMHADARGFFVERFRADIFAEFGLPTEFFQDNHSRSAPGVLRGLHYQTNPSQGKLVGVTRGRIWDVAVDIRPHSSTFGHYFGTELNGENGLLYWIPAGFAHGFCVLGDEPADVVYKVTSPYSAAGDGGIRYDDPEIAIRWPIENPVISSRDQGQQSFAEYKENAPNWNLTENQR